MYVNPVTICKGSTAVLTVNSGASKYTWSTGDTTASVFVSPSVTTSYTVTGSYPEGCTKSAVAVVSVLPNPTASLSLNKDTLFSGECINARDLSGTSGGPVASRKWYYEGGVISTDSAFQYCPPVSPGDHKICLVIKDADGCSDSVCRNIYIRVEVGIVKNIKPQQEKSFSLTILNNSTAEIESWKFDSGFIEIIDMTGKLIYSGTLKRGKNTVDISRMSQGFYVVKAFSGDNREFFKLVKK